jgi:hypothetical protein
VDGGNLVIEVGAMPTPGVTAASLINISVPKKPCA